MKNNFMGWGQVEVDPSKEYFVVTLPINKLTDEEANYFHKHNKVFVSMDFED